MPLPTNGRRVSEPDRPSNDALGGGPGLTPERRAALDALERELDALLQAASRRAA